jgi:kynureninase
LIYLAGHSLGLMPSSVPERIGQELAAWADRGVEAHFGTDGGWYAYHERFAEPLAQLVGATADEVVAMNSLTVNLHLMLVSFFRPRRERRRILIEAGAFPSDRYAVSSHLSWHGLDPVDDLIELEAEDNRLSPELLDRRLSEYGGEVALVLLPGVQFLSGQTLDLANFSATARRHGCKVGFDLAHAIGNVALDLTSAGADFAVWCSYKYLNAGPGSIGGCYVSAANAEPDLPRFAGWWGHAAEQRLQLESRFRPMPGAAGWQLSNPPILAMAPLAASLELFARARPERLHTKSRELTRFLAAQLRDQLGDRIRILTPLDSCGAQLSVGLDLAAGEMPPFIEQLRRRGVVADWRRPNVIRLAPVPLYNRFEDAYRAVHAMRIALEQT